MKAIVRTLICAAVLSMVVPLSAADGVLVVMKVTIGGNPPQTNQIQIDQHRMRMTGTGQNGMTGGMMFDGTRQVMTIIDDASKTYSEITKADLDAFASQMSSAMAQMQDMMKNLPPEQRAQYEAMMKGRMGGAGRGTSTAAAPKVEYHKVGTATVGKWTCDKYDGMTNGQKTHEVCTVDPKVLGFTVTDFQVTRDMAEFFKQFQQIVPGGAAREQPFMLGTPEAQGFSGIPVRSTHTANGTQIVSELTEAHRQAFTDAAFQPPAGYQKQDLLGGRGRRGR